MESWSDSTPPAPATGSPRRLASDRLRSALDAIAQALTAPTFSVDGVRRAVIRYGAIAREQPLQVDEMISTLSTAVRRVIAPLSSTRQEEVLASVQWWAVHGYHRAD